MSGVTSGTEALYAHLETGVTTVARCWEVIRADGVKLGFTDHDRDLSFAGCLFRAETGLTARALQQGTGLSVDNSEAMGALSDAGITDADIEAGRYDAAEVVAWLVDWTDVTARKVLFRGHIGEITRQGAAFQAELRGLAEKLNQPLGRVYQKPCSAVLGDAACGVDLDVPGYALEGALLDVSGETLILNDPGGFASDWFARGRIEILSGAAAGLTGQIKRDRQGAGRRELDLWTPLDASLVPGDRVRALAGCDKRFETCRLKFDNLLNYQGFPDIPGEDWLIAHPTQLSRRAGGSRR